MKENSTPCISLKDLNTVFTELPVMVTIRDHEQDEYVYQSHEQTWAGIPFERWSTLNKKQRADHREEMEICESEYRDWLNSYDNNPLFLQYHLTNKSKEHRWIQCRFEKRFETKHKFIIEISWDITELVNLATNGDNHLSNLYRQAIQERNEAKAQSTMLRDALESLWDENSQRDFAKKMQIMPNGSFISSFLASYTKISVVLDTQVGKKSLMYLRECKELEKTAEWIVDELCPTLINDVQNLKMTMQTHLGFLEKYK